VFYFIDSWKVDMEAVIL